MNPVFPFRFFRRFKQYLLLRKNILESNGQFSKKGYKKTDIEKMTSFNLTCEKGDYQFGLRKPCKRCKITTINQETGEIENPKEPLATLVKLKNSEETHGAFFGQNAILLSNYGVLRVGDLLELNR